MNRGTVRAVWSSQHSPPCFPTSLHPFSSSFMSVVASRIFCASKPLCLPSSLPVRLLSTPVFICSLLLPFTSGFPQGSQACLPPRLWPSVALPAPSTACQPMAKPFEFLSGLHTHCKLRLLGTSRTDSRLRVTSAAEPDPWHLGSPGGPDLVLAGDPVWLGPGLAWLGCCA